MAKYTTGGRVVKNCWVKNYSMPRGKSREGYMNVCKPFKDSASVSNREITIDRERKGYSFNLRKISNNHIVDSKDFKTRKEASRFAKSFMKKNNKFISIN